MYTTVKGLNFGLGIARGWRCSGEKILATASQTIGSLLIPNRTVYRLTSHNRIIPGIPSAAFIARLMFVEMR